MYVGTLCRPWRTEGQFSACPKSKFSALYASLPSWAVEVVQVSMDRQLAVVQHGCLKHTQQHLWCSEIEQG